MANPTKYTPGYSYSGWQASNPSKPLPAQQVDNDFANISQSVNQTIDALKDVRRSDGRLANGIVGPDALSPSLKIGFSFRGAWAEGVYYQAGDGVVYNEAFYSARVSHTSTAANTPVDTAVWLYLFSIEDIVVTGALAMPRNSFTGDGSTTDFTLTFSPASANNLMIALDGVLQDPIEYTINGTTVTFVMAPPAGVTIVVRGFATTSDLVTPVDGSVTPAKLAASTSALFATAAQGVKADGAAQNTSNLSDLTDKPQAVINLGLANVIQSSQYAWPLDKFGTPAVGNDYTLLFAAAINNGETFIIPPKEVGISGPIVLKTGSKGIGANPYKSTIKLLDGSNCNVFESQNAATYFATPPSSGSPATVPHDITLKDFRVNGNRANNTSGHLFYLFCRHHFIEQIMAWNIPQAGFKIKYNDNGSGPITPGGEGMLGMESMLRNIWLDYVGEHGLEVEGVHDSFYENVHVIHASQKANNTYDGIRLLNGFTGRLRNMHVYNSGTVNNHRYGFYDVTGSEVRDFHFEGAATHNMLISGSRGVYEGGYCYANRSPATRNVVITGNENIFSARLGAKATAGDPDVVGVTLGLSGSDFPSANIIDVQVIEQNAGSIDWTYSKGDNTVRMRGEQSTGPKQLGTRQASDEIDGVISGVEFGGANNVAAAGTTQAGATLLTEKNNRVTTVAAGAGVMLPVSSSFIGEFIVVSNITSTPLLVYVNTADSSFDYGPGQFPVSVTLPAGRTAVFTATVSGVVSPIISDANFASISFTPSFASSAGTITTRTINLAKYSRIGKMVHVFYDITINDNGTGSGGIVLGLPFAVASGAGCFLAGRETGSTGKQLQAYGGAGASTVTVTAYDNTYPGGTGYRLILSGTYEAA